MSNFEEFNPILHEQIHVIIENQIRQNNPKETKITLNRLVKNGYTHNEAIHLIGTVLTEEMHDVLTNLKPFNLHRYIQKLENLT